jgi:hypothetical protein
VVVGTANAVSNRQRQRFQAKAAQADLAEMEAQAQQQAAIDAAVAQQLAAQAPAAPIAAPSQVGGGLTDEAVEQLKKLAELREAGVLSDEEFAAQKARYLG